MFLLISKIETSFVAVRLNEIVSFAIDFYSRDFGVGSLV